jgi:hypothetical protein
MMLSMLVRPRHLLQSRLAQEFIETLNEVIATQDGSFRPADGQKLPIESKKKS